MIKTTTIPVFGAYVALTFHPSEFRTHALRIQSFRLSARGVRRLASLIVERIDDAAVTSPRRPGFPTSRTWMGETPRVIDEHPPKFCPDQRQTDSRCLVTISSEFRLKSAGSSVTLCCASSRTCGVDVLEAKTYTVQGAKITRDSPSFRAGRLDALRCVELLVTVKKGDLLKVNRPIEVERIIIGA